MKDGEFDRCFTLRRGHWCLASSTSSHPCVACQPCSLRKIWTEPGHVCAVCMYVSAAYTKREDTHANTRSNATAWLAVKEHMAETSFRW
jgi:hypothetical protein